MAREKLKPVPFRLSSKVIEEVRRRAKKQRISYNELFEQLLFPDPTSEYPPGHPFFDPIATLKSIQAVFLSDEDLKLLHSPSSTSSKP